jgi:hypothetical protein
MEKFFDAMERMENEIPQYGYSETSGFDETDRKVRDLVSVDVREMKDTMFHVVQVSYELQRDSLSKAAEGAWDDVSSLLAKVQSSRLCACRKHGGGGCESCRDNAQKKLDELVRKDRQLVDAVREMKVSVRGLYSALIDKGKEDYFIRNLDQIKKYTETVATILEEREKIVRGA